MSKEKIYSECHIEIPVTEETSFEVKYYGYGQVVNNGIGPYEFWGAKCNDVQLELEFEEIEIGSGLTEIETQQAEQYLKDNFDSIHEKLIDNA